MGVALPLQALAFLLGRQYVKERVGAGRSRCGYPLRWEEIATTLLRGKDRTPAKLHALAFVVSAGSYLTLRQCYPPA